MSNLPADSNLLGSLILLKRFITYLSYRRKAQLISLIFLNIFSSIIEVISIAAIGPFMLALTKPEVPFQYISSSKMGILLNISHAHDVVLPIVISFILLVVISGIARVSVLYFGNNFSFGLGAEVSNSLYRAYLNQSYEEITAQHTSEIINNIFVNANLVIYQVIQPLTILFGGLALISAITVVLLVINPFNALITLMFIIIIYVTIYSITRKKIMSNGYKIENESSRTIKMLQDGIGGIRDILIDGTQETFLNLHARADTNLRRAQAANQFISAVPKLGVEALGLMIIALIGYFITSRYGTSMALSTLAIIAMAGQRVLPAIQQCYMTVNAISGSFHAFKKVVLLIELNKCNENSLETSMEFSRIVELKNIDFKFSNSEKWVLSDINLEIRKGDKLGVIGKTGSGKSCLADIVMGLLTPTNGSLEVDSIQLTPYNIKSWRSIIAHVPQAIFLIDGTIRENIAFGIPDSEIDDKKVQQVIICAQLSEVIEALPNKANSIVGERGIFLSGGQRQRIGIARALYKNAQILIFDEATSALDSVTEKSVMESIYNLDKNITIIIVAHRKSTLVGCDRIVEIDSGRIINIDKYSDCL